LLVEEEQQLLAKLQNNFLNAEEAEMTKEILPRRHLDYLNYYLFLVFQFDRISRSKMIFRSVLRGNYPSLQEGLERGDLLEGNFHIGID